MSEDNKESAIMFLEMPPTEGPTLIEVIEAEYKRAAEELGFSVAAKLAPWQRAVRRVVK